MLQPPVYIEGIAFYQNHFDKKLRYMNYERIYSVEEIAKARGVGNAAIRKHIREGRLPAERVGQRTFYVREHDLAHFNPRSWRKRK